MISTQKPIFCLKNIFLLLLLLCHSIYAKSSGGRSSGGGSSSGGRSSSSSSRSSYSSSGGGSGSSDGPWWVSVIVIVGFILLCGGVFWFVACMAGVHPCFLCKLVFCCKKKELKELKATYIAKRQATLRARSGVYETQDIPIGLQQLPDDQIAEKSLHSEGDKSIEVPDEIKQGETTAMPGYPLNSQQLYSYPPLTTPLQDYENMLKEQPPESLENFNELPFNQGPNESEQIENSPYVSFSLPSEVVLVEEDGINHFQENSIIRNPTMKVDKNSQLDEKVISEPQYSEENLISEQSEDHKQQLMEPQPQQIDQSISKPIKDNSFPPELESEQQQQLPLNQQSQALIQSSSIYPQQPQIPRDKSDLQMANQLLNQQQLAYPKPLQQIQSQNILISQNDKIPQAYPRPNQQPF